MKFLGFCFALVASACLVLFAPTLSQGMSGVTYLSAAVALHPASPAVNLVALVAILVVAALAIAIVLFSRSPIAMIRVARRNLQRDRLVGLLVRPFPLPS